MGFAFSGAPVGLGAGPGRLGRKMGIDARKPRVEKADVAVTIVDRLLTQMRPVVLIGTILVLCLVVYAIAWALKRS